MMKENASIRDHFPLLKEVIYLDSAATALTPDTVIEAMTTYYRHCNANVHRGAYSLSVKASCDFDSVHSKISRFLKTPDQSSITFTKNATEGLNLLAFGTKISSSQNIVLSQLEHHANIVPWHIIAKKTGASLRFIPIHPDGTLNLESLNTLIDKDTAVVSITHGSNVLGTKVPVKQIVKHAHDNEALCFIDAAQTIGHIPVSIKDIGCDALVFSGHKGPMGPTGTGAVYLSPELSQTLKPLIYGGGAIKDVTEESVVLAESPHRYEAGTPHISGIIGLGKGIDFISSIGIEKIQCIEENLTRHILRGISNITNIDVYGPSSQRDRLGVVAFNHKNINCHDLAIILDEMAKVAVRSGFHCAQPLHKALNLQEGTARASFHCYNTEDDINVFLETLQEISD